MAIGGDAIERTPLSKQTRQHNRGSPPRSLDGVELVTAPGSSLAEMMPPNPYVSPTATCRRCGAGPERWAGLRGSRSECPGKAGRPIPSVYLPQPLAMPTYAAAPSRVGGVGSGRVGNGVLSGQAPRELQTLGWWPIISPSTSLCSSGAG